MAIRFQHAIEVAVTPERAFEVLDDLAQTPNWLARCAAIEPLTAGPNAVGTKLRYSYREAGRVKTMDGEITERTPGERLAYRYADEMMAVVVDFRFAASEAGTRVTHAIALTPKTFLAKLLSPLIRRALPKQTIGDMESLRLLLTRQSTPPAAG